MSRPLDLPEPVYDALSQAALASGTTPVGWIAAHLPNTQLSRAVDDTPGPANGAKTLADLFTGRTGRIASGDALAWSENCGEKFTDDLIRKRSEGKL
jgi:hypothetical protein